MILTLTSVNGAAGRARAEQEPGAPTLTLLPAPVSDEPTAAGIPTTASSEARRLDDGASPATFLLQPPPPAARPPGDALPKAEALPAPNQPTPAQAPGQSQPARGAQQPVRQSPASAATPRNRPSTPRTPNPDLEQQVQFGADGLITMHTNELDVRQLLKLLSRRSRMNILVSPKVTGTITVNFEGVTVERVLTAIIKLADLVEKQEGSFHYIYTKGELQDQAEVVKKERILTKVYKLNYIRSDEALNIIRPFLSADVGHKRISVTPSYRFGISESATFVSGRSGRRRRRWRWQWRRWRRWRRWRYRRAGWLAPNRRRCDGRGIPAAVGGQLSFRCRPPDHSGLRIESQDHRPDHRAYRRPAGPGLDRGGHHQRRPRARSRVGGQLRGR